ncbi:MAG: hypothetical protein ACQESP_12155 [Candidatus Muiribacteriota bacterium]
MYKRKPEEKLTGSEQFANIANKEFTVLDFWQYGFSNLNSNIIRGVLAEFLVEKALHDEVDIGLRNPWDDFDVEYKGKKIEVKSCAYLQDWDQERLSNIQWSGLKAKTLCWSSAVKGEFKDQVAEYKSDVYVLALLKHKETDTLDILDLDQWCFYVLSKDRLREISGDKPAVSLSLLERNDVKPVHFADLINVV